MVERLKVYIDGGWVEPAGGLRTLPVVNPATEEAMYDIALGSPADVDRAVAAARAAFAGFSATSREERIDLLQRNTFASQRCDGDDPLVVSTVRPSVNLLQDLGTTTEQNPSPAAVAEYARGLMQPYLNVSRAQLEAAGFSAGATTQLAGRGLYGDYALFIPAAALSVDGGPGLRLDAVDDILLRFDYVAVAR